MIAAIAALVAIGSSPLTRGKPFGGLCVHGQGGLIPAHAGKTTAVRQCLQSGGAHPRSRGENANRAPRYCTVTGSSPLTRGKLLRRDYRRHVRGLIPAHAGKTIAEGCDQDVNGAHPRSRGENAIVVGMVREGMGSSPLTRGKHFESDPDGSQMGLIPAHAGKTLIGGGDERVHWAHPRSRGENSIDGWSMFAVTGSSPLTRGKLQ